MKIPKIEENDVVVTYQPSPTAADSNHCLKASPAKHNCFSIMTILLCSNTDLPMKTYQEKHARQHCNKPVPRYLKIACHMTCPSMKGSSMWVPKDPSTNWFSISRRQGRIRIWKKFREVPESPDALPPVQATITNTIFKKIYDKNLTCWPVIARAHSDTRLIVKQ